MHPNGDSADQDVQEHSPLSEANLYILACLISVYRRVTDVIRQNAGERSEK